MTTSTNYCLSGTMRNGEGVHDGAVAVHTSRYHELVGSTWEILDGPLAGKVVTVKDMGPGAAFDVWVPSCDAARQYGRRTISVRRVG